MKVRHLLSVRRYRRGKQLFLEPWRVHWNIARAQNIPLTVNLVTGGVIRVADVRQCRAMFDWLLEQSDDPSPVSAEGGQVLFHHQGNRFLLRADGADFLVFKEIFADDVYRIGPLGNQLGVVVDIGANVGMFTLRVAPYAERIISVEPVSGNLSAIRKSLEQTDYAKKISLHHRAVGGQSGTSVRIFLSDGNHAGNSSRQEHAALWGTSRYEDVTTISLSELFAQEKVDHCHILKCDVEGAEYDIFLATPVDVLKKIDRILLEAHFTDRDSDRRQFELLCQHFIGAGFAVEHEPLENNRGHLKSVIMVYADRTTRR